MDADDLSAVVDFLSAAIRRKEPLGFEISHMLVAGKAINFTAAQRPNLLVVADRPR